MKVTWENEKGEKMVVDDTIRLGEPEQEDKPINLVVVDGEYYQASDKQQYPAFKYNKGIFRTS